MTADSSTTTVDTPPPTPPDPPPAASENQDVADVPGSRDETDDTATDETDTSVTTVTDESAEEDDAPDDTAAPKTTEPDHDLDNQDVADVEGTRDETDGQTTTDEAPATNDDTAGTATDAVDTAGIETTDEAAKVDDAADGTAAPKTTQPEHDLDNQEVADVPSSRDETEDTPTEDTSASASTDESAGTNEDTTRTEQEGTQPARDGNAQENAGADGADGPVVGDTDATDRGGTDETDISAPMPTEGAGATNKSPAAGVESEATESGHASDDQGDSGVGDTHDQVVDDTDSADGTDGTGTDQVDASASVAGEPDSTSAGTTREEAPQPGAGSDTAEATSDGVSDTATPSAHAVDGTATGAEGWKEVEARPGQRSLGEVPGVVERGPDGLIARVDGRPVAEHLSEVAGQRADRYRDVREPRGDLSAQGIGPYIAVVVDRGTGEMVEATNGRTRDVIPPERVHPLLAERLAAVEAAGPYDRVNKDGSVDPGSRDFPGPADPLGHAEVKAVNELLWKRGADADPSVFAELRMDTRMPFLEDGPKPGPCCPNCTALLYDVPNNNGKIRAFPASDPQSRLPE